MSIPRHTWKWVLLAFFVLTGGLAAVTLRLVLGPSPRLEDVRSLARARHFGLAQAQLTSYLRWHPRDDTAHLLMARITTEGTNAQPELALQHLSSIRPAHSRDAAIVKFFEGKAQYQQKKYDLAEGAWNEALRLDPTVPEAGWALIDLLDKEGRVEEAHSLGMLLHEREPDPRDRVRLLLELCRLDIEAPTPSSQIDLFEPLVARNSDCFPISLTVGLAMIRHSRAEDGINLLREALNRHSQSPTAWDAWLTGLHETSEHEKLAEAYPQIPGELASDPRLAKHEGLIAQMASDWKRAVCAYRRAYAFEPYNQGVMYRYRLALRQAGLTAEHDRVNKLYNDYKDAFLQMRGIYFEKPFDKDKADFPIEDKDFTQSRGAYFEVLALKDLGLRPRPALYQRLADLREKMGRADEARAWHRLVVRDDPTNARSLAALNRLK